MSVLLAAPPHPVPSPDLDVGAAVTRFRRLAAVLPGTAVHYAVAADPRPALLAALAGAGARFAVTGRAEVVAALDAGATPADLLHGHPLGRPRDVAVAARAGVRSFVVATRQDVRTVAAAAPGSSVLCRLAGDGSAGVAETAEVLRRAAEAGLDPAGVGVFATGDPQAWAGPVEAAARVFTRLRGEGLRPWLLDLGGGFPAAREEGALPLPAYGAAIELLLRRHFGSHRPRTLVQPGRAVLATLSAPATPRPAGAPAPWPRSRR